MTEALNQNYTIGEEIGRGRFGVVCRCSSISTGESFAVKSIDKSLLLDPLDRACVDAEAKLTLLASSRAAAPRTVRILAAYEDSSSLHLVLDLCDGPTLLDRIKDRAPFSEPEAAAIAADLLEAVASCHKNGVAHRDVKPENVLFDGRGRLKLADFGSAGRFGVGSAMRGLVGTAYYVAPEVVRGEEYGERVDVWSAGVVLYAMLGGVLPFDGESAVEVLEAVVRGNLRFPCRVFGRVSAAAKDLMRRMMSRDASRRLSAEQALRHPWIAGGGRARATE